MACVASVRAQCPVGGLSRQGRRGPFRAAAARRSPAGPWLDGPRASGGLCEVPSPGSEDRVSGAWSCQPPCSGPGEFTGSTCSCPEPRRQRAGRAVSNLSPGREQPWRAGWTREHSCERKGFPGMGDPQNAGDPRGIWSQPGSLSLIPGWDSQILNNTLMI